MTIFVLIRDEDDVRRECAERNLTSLNLEVRDENVFVGAVRSPMPASERHLLQHLINRLMAAGRARRI
ncbi:hypothetical protein [Caballeronia sp. LZ032]|uniref:hypothetical protein n=1 Tax=Caballeronia sp. LZ032 TaxID=3038565 RepID=UPI00286605AB|nr:hypothetical protein [Caballeronia sp. LZ032]MDR5883780.1 hypothetical protein [Caballeronia sp. LZ032]